MKKYAVLFPLALAVIGCASPVPVAHNFPASEQMVARTAHHWDVVAQDVVAQTTAAIAANPVLQKRGIFVPAVDRSTAFNVVFRDFLVNNMVNQGLPVSVCKSTQSSGTGFAMEGPDVEVQYEARIIGHAANLPKYIPGTITALAAGVSVIYNMAEHMSSANAAAAGAGLAVLADVAASNYARPTQTELIVTTTITENNRYIMRKSAIYYVPDNEANLFIQRVSQRSSCPQDNGPVAKQDNDPVAKADRTADDADSRRVMFEREMKRSNPDWQPTSPASVAPVAWAY